MQKFLPLVVVSFRVYEFKTKYLTFHLMVSAGDDDDGVFVYLTI